MFGQQWGWAGEVRPLGVGGQGSPLPVQSGSSGDLVAGPVCVLCVCTLVEVH